MKSAMLPAIFSFALAGAAIADAPDAKDPLAKHGQGAERVAEEQDELAADVQQLVSEQTVPTVIELLTEVEDIMDEAVERLAEADTGGDTIAAQTEVIEKIHEAAKERQQQSGGSPSGGAMMDMMERMMGKDPQEGQGEKGEQPGEGEGDGDAGGGGTTGDSDLATEATPGAATGAAGARSVPKASGTAGRELPAEFRKAFDAYNRGLGQKSK